MAGAQDFDNFYYPSFDGLRLHARVYGDPGGPRLPVVCLPGLTRNTRDFHGLATYLREAAPNRRVVAFDYRGRGLSDRDPDWRNYNLAVEARDIVDGLAALGIPRAAFVGTSRGGLILHILATTAPGMLAAIVLNDVGPVIGREGLAHIRGYLQRPARPQTMDDAIRSQKDLHGPAFPALGDADWRRMAEAIYRIEDGRPVADFDPALVNTLATADPDAPIADLWPQFDLLAGLPVLVLRGETSRLLEAATVEEMHRRHPDLTSIDVPGQGHPPLLETAGLPDIIARFIEQGEGRDRTGLSPKA